MSQKVKIVSAKVRGEVYLGVCYHPVNGMPGDSWSHDGDVVTNWLADGYRARFNQHRSKRSKYLSIAGEIFEDKGGERVLVPLGDSVDDYTDAEARRMFPHLAALPTYVIQAAEKMENTEWWAAIRRRKTNLEKGQLAGAIPGFVSRHHADQSFTCWFNAGRNAVFRQVSKKSGVVTITGQNPTGKYGPGGAGLRWSVEYHVLLSQKIRPYTSVRVNWTTKHLVFVNAPQPVTKLSEHRGQVGVDRGITGMRNVGLADLQNKLEYRARLLLDTIIGGVNPAYTSQRCNKCGHTCKENRESQAVFQCVRCGHADNADINAAKNILELYLANGAGLVPAGSKRETDPLLEGSGPGQTAVAMNREPNQAA